MAAEDLVNRFCLSISCLMASIAIALSGCATTAQPESTGQWFLRYWKEAPKHQQYCSLSLPFAENWNGQADYLLQSPGLVCASTFCDATIEGAHKGAKEHCIKHCKGECYTVWYFDKSKPGFNYSVKDVVTLESLNVENAKRKALARQAEYERSEAERRFATCDKFGFKRDSQPHAECVMQLFLHEQSLAQRNRELQANAQIAERANIINQQLLDEYKYQNFIKSLQRQNQINAAKFPDRTECRVNELSRTLECTSWRH